MFNDMTFDPVCTCFELDDGTLDTDENCVLHGEFGTANIYLAGTYKEG